MAAHFWVWATRAKAHELSACAPCLGLPDQTGRAAPDIVGLICRRRWMCLTAASGGGSGRGGCARSTGTSSSTPARVQPEPATPGLHADTSCQLNSSGCCSPTLVVHCQLHGAVARCQSICLLTGALARLHKRWGSRRGGNWARWYSLLGQVQDSCMVIVTMPMGWCRQAVSITQTRRSVGSIWVLRCA